MEYPTEQLNENGDLPKPTLNLSNSQWMRKTLFNIALYFFVFFVILKLNAIYAAAILLVIIIHDVGHFILMKKYKYVNSKLLTFPYLAKYLENSNTISDTQLCYIILSGPIPGIIIGFILKYSNQFYDNENIVILSNIFIGLNFFYLLPFASSDGEHFLETLFYKNHFVVKMVVGICTVIILLLLPLFLSSIWLLILPISIIFELISEFKNQKIRQYLNQENINYFIHYKDLSNHHYWLIRDCILLQFNKRYSIVEAGKQAYSIIEPNLLAHLNTVIKQPIQNTLTLIKKIGFVTLFFVFIVLPICYFIPMLADVVSQILKQ